jgi:hypothetical protein
MTMVDTPVAVCEYCGSPELAHYIQHNHLMYVSGDDERTRVPLTVGRRSSVTWVVVWVYCWAPVYSV